MNGAEASPPTGDLSAVVAIPRENTRPSGFRQLKLHFEILLSEISGAAYTHCMKKQLKRIALSSLCIATFLLATADAQLLPSQDILQHDPPAFSGLELNLVPYVKLPEDPILSTSSPAHDNRLYISSSIGRINIANPVSNGGQPVAPFQAQSSIWFDVSNDLALNFDNRGHGGLRSFAFHPEFAANGKFYVSAMVDRPEDISGLNYLGQSQLGPGIQADSVLVEFTFDHEANSVQADSARELFRITMPHYDHPIKQIKFDPFAQPSDENYGLLYVNHGDSSIQAASDGGGQNLDDALGKVLRINPLAAGEQPYTVPASNPYANSTDGSLPEIFASGFRNPHNLSFAQLGDGRSQLIVADIGRSHFEEVNLVDAGQNYGWSTREGPLVHLQTDDGNFGNGVEPLPANEATANNGQSFTYPATMFDHRRVDQNLAIAGSHVIDNGSPLSGQYVFADFGSSGHVYHVAFEDLLSATTQLDENDPSRDEPGELTYAVPSRIRLNFDADNDATTPAESHDTTTSLLDRSRSDLRFGVGNLGELYLTSKSNGTVYLATNSLPPGDVDLNGDVDFVDFLVLSENFGQVGTWWQGDFDGNGTVQFPDFLALSSNFGRDIDRVSLAQEGLAVSSVPEPTSGVLLIGLMSLTWITLGRNAYIVAQAASL